MQGIENLLEKAGIHSDCIEKIVCHISTYAKLKAHIKNYHMDVKRYLRSLFSAKMNNLQDQSSRLNNDLLASLLGEGWGNENIMTNPLSMRYTHKIRKHIHLGKYDMYLWKFKASDKTPVNKENKNYITYLPCHETSPHFDFSSEEIDSIKKLIEDLTEEVRIYDLEKERNRLKNQEIFDSDFDLEELTF